MTDSNALSTPAAGREPDDLGLSIDMLDVDRLREWARLLLVHGADISHWGSVPFVAGKMQIMATEIEKAVREIGVLRSALSALQEAGAAPASADWPLGKECPKCKRITMMAQSFCGYCGRSSTASAPLVSPQGENAECEGCGENKPRYVSHLCSECLSKSRKVTAVESSPQGEAKPSEKFWREIDGMSKREVAELLHHTQGERDRAVERANSAASAEGSKP